MALTSYFNRTLRYKDLTYDEIKIIEAHYDLSKAKYEDKNNGCRTLKDWCGVEEKDVPHKYAINYYCDEYKPREKYNELRGNFSVYSLIEEVGYIQELYFLHDWIKKNVLNETNKDFGAVELTKENIEQLLILCENFTANKHDFSEFEKYNFDKAIKVLKHILETTNFVEQIIFYNVFYI